MTVKEDIRQTDRQTTGIVGDLVAHLDWKMGALPELAKRFHLSPQATEFLRNHLQEEKDQLLSLPQDADIGEWNGDSSVKPEKLFSRPKESHNYSNKKKNISQLVINNVQSNFS